jgi:transposase-like protein
MNHSQTRRMCIYMIMKFMEQTSPDPKLICCPYCEDSKRIGIHSYTERRYKCHTCGHTFAETKGTVFYGLHYPIWMIVVIMSLLSHGCPIPAIVSSFFIDERTVRLWLERAGQHSRQVQEELVCNGRIELGQVQADELCVNVQGDKVWVAAAVSVLSRLFLWGEVSLSRDASLVERLMIKVREAASGTVRAVLIAVDGFAAYPKMILKTFNTKLRNGLRGRPKHLIWPNLHIVQVVKSCSGRKVKNVSRRIVHGCQRTVQKIINRTQGGIGMINTAFIERLNATFRSRMPSLVRRTRNIARTTVRVEQEVFWSGAVYNFCTIHRSLRKTPAMAAHLTDHCWSVKELLYLRISSLQ